MANVVAKKRAQLALCGLLLWQTGVDCTVMHYSFEENLVRDRLKTLAKPKYAHCTVYVPHFTGLLPGEDISREEARERLAVVSRRLAMAKALSPLHQLYALSVHVMS